MNIEIHQERSALKPPYDKPIVGEDRRKLIRVALGLIAAGVLLTVLIFLLAYNETLQFYPNNVGPGDLDKWSKRAEYALKYQLLLVLWLLINVYLVMYVRVTKGALNPLTRLTEYHTRAINMILRNSVEQILISLFAQFIVLAFAQSTTVLMVIPAINIIQFIGRVTFFFGYPIYRSFGMTLTLLPNTAMVAYGVFKFIQFLITPSN